MNNNSGMLEMVEGIQIHQFHQRSDAYKKYVEHENPTKEEELKSKLFICKIKDFNNKVLNMDFRDICSFYRKFGYISNEGYYTVIDYERGRYVVMLLGNDINQAFQYLIVNILFQTYEISEEEKATIHLKHSIFDDFIADDCCNNAMIEAEFVLSVWKKYISDNPVENDNVTKYIENMTNEYYLIKDLDVKLHYDDEQGKFIFIQKEKNR